MLARLQLNGCIRRSLLDCFYKAGANAPAFFCFVNGVQSLPLWAFIDKQSIKESSSFQFNHFYNDGDNKAKLQARNHCPQHALTTFVLDK
jgi:hypothetical protein